MARSNPELWHRLAEFEVSPPASAFSFAHRLAREHGWPPGFARRAFEEYRRFLYLAVVSGQRLAASDAVERVWQLHLSYRASYGQALCREVLGQRLHHRPPDGAEGEACYRATLAAYEQEFGSAPPAEIWPAAGRRRALPAVLVDAPARQPRQAEPELVPLMPAPRPA